MASSEGPHYRVDPTGPANQQMRDLIAKAAAGTERQHVADALEVVFSQLETRPADWGDPLWRTRKEGGLVYHAIQASLVVRYVVFEPEKVVWLLEVRALPNTPLAE
jgi:hypothetical protein